MVRDKNWTYTFTQEWPAPGQTHQLSYTIPVISLPDSDRVTGIGDVALNYRYQAIMKDRFVFAPRFSLLLPTGDRKRGLGNGALGFQINIPLSVELNDGLLPTERRVDLRAGKKTLKVRADILRLTRSRHHLAGH
jgi:hypothetical protein